jgi:hypothetical protein
MERTLNQWERGVVEALATADGPGSDVVRESLPHLVWTGGCGCGCASFNVRDARLPPQRHELEHFANGWTPDRHVEFMLWIGPDGRPKSVDVESDDHMARPDPATIVVKRP